MATMTGMELQDATLLFFGSFNPVRSEHLLIAERTLETTPARELWFVVSPQNPFKEVSDLAPEKDRLEMVRLAIDTSRYRERLQVSDIEFGLEKPSLTIRTLEKLALMYPGRPFALLIGSDNADRFRQWVRYEEILQNFPVAVYPRRGYPLLRAETDGKFLPLEHVPPGIGAATDIRTAIAQGRNPQEQLPAPVWQYIKTRRLYGYEADRR